MSYSFSVMGPRKAIALAAATAALDKVIHDHPPHLADRESALANVRNHLDLLPEATDAQDVHIYMTGSMATSEGALTNAGSGCHVFIYKKAENPV